MYYINILSLLISPVNPLRVCSAFIMYCSRSVVICFQPRKLAGIFLGLLSYQFYGLTLCLEMQGRGSLVVSQPKAE